MARAAARGGEGGDRAPPRRLLGLSSANPVFTFTEKSNDLALDAGTSPAGFLTAQRVRCWTTSGHLTLLVSVDNATPELKPRSPRIIMQNGPLGLPDSVRLLDIDEIFACFVDWFLFLFLKSFAEM